MSVWRADTRKNPRLHIAVLAGAAISIVAVDAAHADVSYDLVSPSVCDKVDGQLVNCSIAGQRVLTVQAPQLESSIPTHTSFKVVSKGDCATPFLRSMKIDIPGDVDNTARLFYLQQSELSVRRCEGRPIQSLILTDPYELSAAANAIAGFDASCHIALTIKFNVADLPANDPFRAVARVGDSSVDPDGGSHPAATPAVASFELVSPDVCATVNGKLVNCAIAGTGQVTVRAPPAQGPGKKRTTLEVTSTGDCVTLLFARALKIDVTDEAENSSQFFYLQHSTFAVWRRNGTSIDTITLTDPHGMPPKLNRIAHFSKSCRMRVTVRLNVPDVCSMTPEVGPSPDAQPGAHADAGVGFDVGMISDSATHAADDLRADLASAERQPDASGILDSVTRVDSPASTEAAAQQSDGGMAGDSAALSSGSASDRSPVEGGSGNGGCSVAVGSVREFVAWPAVVLLLVPVVWRRRARPTPSLGCSN